MILVLSGRQQDEEIAKILRAAGQAVELIDLTQGEMNISWEKVIQSPKINAIIDATHPFSEKPSLIVKNLAEKRGIRYLRYLEKEEDIPEHPLVHPVNSWEEGAKRAGKLGKTIFLTTGSNNLEVFLQEKNCQGKRLVIRILPDYKVVKKCQELGFVSKDIVAMQGPFSKDLNRSIFKAYGASVVVTRESGKRGGADNKIAAALALKIPVVIIRKNPVGDQEARSYQEILAFLKLEA